jgi:hypothetical protein
MKRLSLALSLLVVVWPLPSVRGQELEINTAETPVAWLRPAPLLRMPGEVDCNSPAHWSGNRLIIFNSLDAQTHSLPVRNAGLNFKWLRGNVKVRFDDQGEWNGRRWIEATYKAANGRLYGWYHNEPNLECPGLTAPRIGAAWSENDGLTWHNLGIVLEAPPGTENCAYVNGYFTGGHGDFSVIADQFKRYYYFFFTNYAGPEWEQGVAVARMAFGDRDEPAGKVWKWSNGAWSEPGVGGHVTPVFRTWRSWENLDPDSFWGPSVHWNTHLKSFVILLNRTAGGWGDWRQEGTYVTFNPRLSNPAGWSTPQKILHGGSWYPQVLGMDTAKRETDKLGGQVARFFVHGASNWEIVFAKPSEEVPAQTIPIASPTATPQPIDLPLPQALGSVENKLSSPASPGFRGRPPVR